MVQQLTWDQSHPSGTTWTGFCLIHQAVKLGVRSSMSIPTGRGTYETGLKQAMKTWVNYTKKWSKCLWPLLLLHRLCFTGLYLLPHGEFPKTCWLRKRKPGLGLQLVHIIRGYQKWPPVAPQLLSNTFLKNHGWKEVFLENRTLDSAARCSYCLEEETARGIKLYWFIGCGQQFDWIVSNLERQWSENR